MGKKTGTIIGTLMPDNLIASTYPPAQTFTIDLKESSEVIERGTVMSFESEEGSYAVLGAGTGKASCIIADTTEAEDAIATAYRSGHFYRNALITKDATPLTAENENDLRLAGIFLSDGV